MTRPIPPVSPSPAPEAPAFAGRAAHAQGHAAPPPDPQAIARVAEQFAVLIEQLCLILSQQIESGPLYSRLAAPLLMLVRHGLRRMTVRFTALANLTATPAVAPTPIRANPRITPPRQKTFLQRWLPAWLRRADPASHRAAPSPAESPRAGTPRPPRPRSVPAAAVNPQPSLAPPEPASAPVDPQPHPRRRIPPAVHAHGEAAPNLHVEAAPNLRVAAASNRARARRRPHRRPIRTKNPPSTSRFRTPNSLRYNNNIAG